jgi:hypothetical protein
VAGLRNKICLYWKDKFLIQAFRLMTFRQRPGIFFANFDEKK